MARVNVAGREVGLYSYLKSARDWRQPFRPFSKHILSSLAMACALGAGIACPARGAERIQFFFGPFEPTIYIEDLATLAEEGVIPDRLKPIANRFDEAQIESVRKLLNTSFDVDLIMLGQFTYGTVGEDLLRQAGDLVLTDNFLNGFHALRATLLLAAAEEEDCCTVLDFLQYHPLETIQLNMFLVLQVIEENQRIFQLRDEVVAGVREIALEQVQEARIISLPAFEPHQSGPYRWRQETFTFQNPDRSVPSTADLYLPSLNNASPTETPVVVISHGIASDRLTFAYLAEHLASHGYGVIVLEHAETSAERFDRFLRGFEGPPAPSELLNRPRDITAVLDTLESRSTTELELQTLNLQAVGVLGQSLGGYTALAAAGAELNRPELENQCLSELADRPSVNLSLLIQCRLLELDEDTSLAVQDERVQAVIALNPVTSSIFGEAGLSRLQTPVLMVGGSDDYIAPIVPEQIMPFTWFTHEESYLAIVERGTHFSFLDTSGEGPLPVPESFIGPDPRLARPQLKGLTLAFFNRYLLDRTDEYGFLTQAYLETMDQDPFQYDIIHNFFDEE